MIIDLIEVRNSTVWNNLCPTVSTGYNNSMNSNMVSIMDYSGTQLGLMNLNKDDNVN